MRNQPSHTSRLLGCCLVAGLLTLPAGAVSGPGQGTPLADALDGLRRQYSAIHSIELDATVLMTMHKPSHLERGAADAIVGSASFSYAADQVRFRVRTHTDERFDLVNDFDIAFDGQLLQRLDFEASVLLLSRNTSWPLPISLPNPFFLGLDFLSREDDDCQLCRLKLADLQSPALWNEKMAAAVLLEGLSGPAATELVAEVPGGTYGGHRFDHRLVFTPRAKGLPTLTRIERLTSSGKRMMQIDLGAFEAAGGQDSAAALPRQLNVTVFDFEGNGQPVLEASFVIDRMVLNQSLDPALFKLVPDASMKVFDEDAGQFLKHEQLPAR